MRKWLDELRDQGKTIWASAAICGAGSFLLFTVDDGADYSRLAAASAGADSQTDTYTRPAKGRRF